MLPRVVFLATTLCWTGCSDGSSVEAGDAAVAGGSRDGPPAEDAGVTRDAIAIPDASARELSFDLRFKWTGNYPGFLMLECDNVRGVETMRMGGPIGATPLMLDAGPSWSFEFFAHAINTPLVDNWVRSGDVASLTADVADLEAMGLIVMSLDVEGTAYAVATSGPFDTAVKEYRQHDVYSGSREALDAWAATEGAASAVVTAVTAAPGDQGPIHAFSFSRDFDTKSYETRLVDTSLGDLTAQVGALAGAGYVITGFGRTGPGAFLLVGTRVQAATAPREVQIMAGDICGTEKAMLESDFGIVGVVTEGTGAVVIGQR